MQVLAVGRSLEVSVVELLLVGRAKVVVDSVIDEGSIMQAARGRFLSALTSVTL